LPIPQCNANSEVLHRKIDNLQHFIEIFITFIYGTLISIILTKGFFFHIDNKICGIFGATIASLISGILMCLKIKFNFDESRGPTDVGGLTILCFIIGEYYIVAGLVCIIGFFINLFLWYFLSNYVTDIIEISCMLMGFIVGIFTTAIIGEFAIALQHLERQLAGDDDLMQQFIDNVGRSVLRRENNTILEDFNNQSENNNNETRIFVTAPDIQPEAVKEKLNQCKICWENESTHAFNNCGHKCICVKCALEYDSHNQSILQKKCILCRKSYGKIIHIF
jgi:hypothetical protein